MNKKKIVETRIKDSVSEGRITCSKLRKIAKEADTTYKMAGIIADRLKIKIVQCELGCF